MNYQLTEILGRIGNLKPFLKEAGASIGGKWRLYSTNSLHTLYGTIY